MPDRDTYGVHRSERLCAVLLVEQHIELALQAATRSYVMRRGDVVLSGTSERFLEDRSLVTSSYLGA
jgi:branched-chain amino acid transport system ATP-binding protein